MAMPKYLDEALITLTCVGASSVALLPVRELNLSTSNNSLRIGRTSKRDSAFQAKKDNGWFDSPVMSREHAQIQLDGEKQLTICDTGSLHGTFLNGRRLEAKKPQTLVHGDDVTFGVTVDRGLDAIPAYKFKVKATFGTESRPRMNPTVYRVPDDSDMEDVEEDDEQIRSALRIMGSVTAPSVGPAPSSEHVDLTASTAPSDKPASTYIDLTSVPNKDAGPQESVPHDDQHELASSIQNSRTSPRYSPESPAYSVSSPNSLGEELKENSQQDRSNLVTQPGEDSDMLDDFDCDGAIYGFYEEPDFEEQDSFESSVRAELEGSFEPENGESILDSDSSNDASLPNSQSSDMNSCVSEDWDHTTENQPENLDQLPQSIMEEVSEMPPSLEDHTSQLPPLAEYNSTDQTRVRLPSISTLTGPRPPASDTLEKLISHSGKPEFFYAREENRFLAQPHLVPFSSTGLESNESQVTQYTAVEAPAAEVSQSQHAEDDEGKLLAVSEATSVEPNERSMPEEQLPLAEFSQKPNMENIRHPQQGVKRKAEQVSASTEEEEFEMALNTRAKAVFSSLPSSAPPTKMLIQPSVPSLDHEQVPVTKRLRRVAEFAGIAALGGVAVMSALIATAPAL